MPDDFDWLGPATDLLHEKCLDEAAACLHRHLRAVQLLERRGRADYRRSTFPGNPYWRSVVAVIAEARGETPEETWERLFRGGSDHP